MKNRCLTYKYELSLKGTDRRKIMLGDYIPLGDTRYVIRISKFVKLTNKNNPANFAAFALAKNICGLWM